MNKFKILIVLILNITCTNLIGTNIFSFSINNFFNINNSCFNNSKIFTYYDMLVDTSEISENISKLDKDSISKSDTYTSSQFQTLSIGDKDPIVEFAQKKLGLKVDGIFGNETKNSILLFQKKNKLVESGFLDYETYNCLRQKKTIELNTNKTKSIEINNTTFIVKEAQKILELNDTSGIFCEETLLAVKDFQKDNNLKVDGKIGSQTIKSLRAYQNNKLNSNPNQNISNDKKFLKTSIDGINFIKKVEGFSATSYKDDAGIWTIGFGSTCDTNYNQIQPRDIISENDANKFLIFYLTKVCEPSINKLVKINLNQNEFDALVSFVYNVGPYNFRKSTLLKLLNENKKLEAFDELEKWKYANGELLSGLVKRRDLEKKLANTIVLNKPENYRIIQTEDKNSLKSDSATYTEQTKFISKCIISDPYFNLPTNVNPEENIIEKVIEYVKNKRTKKAYFDATPYYQEHASDLKYYLENFSSENLFSEDDWSKKQQKIIKHHTSDHKELSTYKAKTYVFHPYWMGASYKNYPFDIIERIGYYGYVINPKDGSDLSSSNNSIGHGFSNDNFNNFCDKLGIPVDLVISSYDIKNNIEIFKNNNKGSKIRCNAIYNIVELVKSKGNGICFDIQKVPFKFKDQYISMIIEIATLLKQSDINSKSNFQISLVIPSFDVGVPYELNYDDLTLLNNYVDRWIFKATTNFYDNELIESKNGEINNWDLESLTDKINKLPIEIIDKMNFEISFNQSKISLEDSSLINVPYYKLMEFDSTAAFSIYEQIRNQLYFLQKSNIKNISIWSPSYDNDTEDLTSLIEFFLQGNDIRIDPKNIDYVYKNLKSYNKIKNDKISIDFINSLNLDLKEISPIIEFKRSKNFKASSLIILILLTIIFFIFLGFIIAIFYEYGRERIFQIKNLSYILFLLLITASVILLKEYRYINNPIFTLIIGTIFGILLSSVLFRRINKVKKETP